MSATGSISGSAAQLHNQVSIAVAKKAQDHAKSQGDAAVQLLQAAADLQKQQLSSATEPHLGGLIDTVA